GSTLPCSSGPSSSPKCAPLSRRSRRRSSGARATIPTPRERTARPCRRRAFTRWGAGATDRTFSPVPVLRGFHAASRPGVRRRSTQCGEAMKQFSIEIYSDIVCPWCYVGKRYIDKALEHYRRLHAKERQPDVSWLPFQLHAALPREGVDRKEYLKRRYPGKANDPAMFADVERAGRQMGIE